MTITTTLSTYGTADLVRNTAVQDVDVKQAGPGGQTTAKAAVVISGGGGGSGAAGFTTVGPAFVPDASVTKASGTITAGGTAQDILTAGQAPHGWAIENQSAGDLYWKQDANATADNNSFKIPPGMEYVADYITGGRVSIIGATTGQAFWARGW